MKLADTAIRRPVTTLMVILALVTFGWVGFQRMGIDMFPNVDFPVVTVLTIYRGADPTTVEEKVTKKLEDAVNQVSGIKFLRSYSLENVSQVILMFDISKDINIAAQEVRDKVSSALRELPEGIDPPQVEKVDVGAAPILTVTVTGDGTVSRAALGTFAEKGVKDRLRQIEGVGGIDLVGRQDRVVWFRAHPDALARHNVTLVDVVSALKYQNLEVPAGAIPVGMREVSMKTRGYAASLGDLGGITVVNFMGAEVKLRDLGVIQDDFEEERSRSEVNGQTSISVVVRKQSGTNTVAMAHKVKDMIPAIQALAPAGVRLDVVGDTSVFVEESVRDSLIDLVLGAILAVVIIALFLRNVRMTFIAAVAIPASVVGAFAFMKAMGFTLNYLTLLALSLSVGLLVDDAIVVLENIFRHVEHGEGRGQAAHKATDEIGLAVTATTFSLVAVFGPIATTGGMIGRFLRDFGLTVVVAVLISLFVSFTLTPMMAARMVTEPHQNAFTRWIERFLEWIERSYVAALAFCLRHKGLVLLAALAVFGTSLWMGSFLRQEMVPRMDQSMFQIRVETPPGSALAQTREVVKDVLAALEGVPGVKYTVATIGGGVQEKVELADVRVELVDKGERGYGQADLMNRLRAQFLDYPRAKVAVEDTPIFSIGGMSQSLIQFNIRGADFAEMDRQAQKIMARMREAGGYTDIDSTYRTGKPEFGVVPDRDRAYALGVPVALVGQTLRLAVAGDKVSDFKDKDEMFDVKVRLDEGHRGDLGTLQALQIRTPYQQMVQVGNVTRLEPGEGPLTIDRQAGQRQITILANLSGKVLEDAMTELRAWAKEDVTTPGYVTDFSGEAQFMEENFKEIFLALFLAILMIYFILASQFESLIHPFTIMLSLPLSLVGGIGALLAVGSPLSILSMIGFIMLMGLVTKNAILLVDFAIQGRGRGMSIGDAVLEAGRIRLRPILMTTAAMVFGMLPIAFGMSKGSEIRSPMALVVIGGVLASTVLTLVVVPVVYSLIEAGLHRMGLSASAREIDDLE